MESSSFQTGSEHRCVGSVRIATRKEAMNVADPTDEPGIEVAQKCLRSHRLCRNEQQASREQG